MSFTPKDMASPEQESDELDSWPVTIGYMLLALCVIPIMFITVILVAYMGLSLIALLV